MSDKTIDKSIYEQFHKNLLEREVFLNDLKKRRGLSDETIKRFMIGYEVETGRYTIPILNGMDSCVNIRRWFPDVGEDDPKIISWKEGYGGNRLFPHSVLLDNIGKRIIICEGEWDCILLNQNEMPAITTTCGANSWNEEWNDYFKNTEVVIIYDNDDSGREGSMKVARNVMPICKVLKIINIEINKDITDWFVKYNKTANELLSKIEKATNEDGHEHVDLSKSVDGKFYDKPIKFNAIVVGKDLATYLVPKRARAFCFGTREADRCTNCPMQENGEAEKEFDYENDKKSILKFINCNDKQLLGEIKKCMSLPLSDVCRSFRLDITDRMNIEDVRMIPELDFENVDKEYVIRKCFFIGLGIQTNQSYVCKGTTLADPNNQTGLHLLCEAKGSRDSISRFELTAELKEKLKIFQPIKQDDVNSIKEKLNEIYTDFTNNITKAYGRESILMATDLVYHSVLQFDFLNNFVDKGWVEMLCVGDTKCGKTMTIKNILLHYRAGEFLSSGENTTIAGILGGVQPTYNGRWTVTWGKIPLNDKRLLVVDEADNLTEQGIIGRLSGVRSSGIAELVKIQPQRTTARTRIIWIANPLHGKVNEHNYGIEIVRQLFQKHQDISRLDFSVIVSREDISDTEINRRHDEKFPHIYTSELCHLRVMWAWSRKRDNIVWRDGSEDLILVEAQQFGNKYSAEIPLAIGAEMRIKLARLSVALAAMVNSTDETGQNIVVYPAHVLCVSLFLQEQYDCNVMGFYNYSSQRKRENEMKDTETIDNLIITDEQINMFLDNNKIQLTDIEDIFGCDIKEAKKNASILRQVRALRKVHTFYRKTPSFIKYLKKRKGDKDGDISN